MEYLLALIRWKKQILGFVIAATVLTVGVSLLLPKWYKSSVTLLQPRSQGALGGLGAFSSLLKDLAPTSVAGRFGSANGGVNYLAILRSRRAWEEMIRRYDLMATYGIDNGSMEAALKEFESNFDFEVSEDGSIALALSDKDSVRAAAMANGMVEILNSIAIDLGTREARDTRLFLERRLEEARTDLAAAEEKLKTYQEERGMLIVSDQAKETATAIGQVYARKVQLEIQLAMLEKTTGPDNPGVQQLELEKRTVDRKLATFPGIGMTSLRLYRDVVVQQKILEFLVPMHEQARLEEQKNIPVVLVLDRAVPAEKKARPKRMMIVAASTFSSFILAVMAVCAMVRFDVFKRERPDRYQKLRNAFRKGAAV